MAKKQTRRSVSLNRNVYEAATQEAARRGMSLAGFVEHALGTLGVPIAAHPQMSPAQVRARAERLTAQAAARKNGTRLPSRERQLLGDAYADACGFA